MKKINTTEKGNIFEEKVFHFINSALNKGYLGVNPQRCKIYKKKKYFSKDRDDNIIFDLSIEVFLFDIVEWSLLFLFECKNYLKSIGINEIEEFYSKVQQVSGLNVKAFFVTNSKLQKSAYKFATSKGITVIGNNSELFNKNSNEIPTLYGGGGFLPVIPIGVACVVSGYGILKGINYLIKQNQIENFKLTKQEEKIINMTINTLRIETQNIKTKVYKKNDKDDRVGKGESHP